MFHRPFELLERVKVKSHAVVIDHPPIFKLIRGQNGVVAFIEQLCSVNWKEWADLAWEIVIFVSPGGQPQLNPGFRASTTKICTVRKSRTDPYYGNVVSAPSKPLDKTLVERRSHAA